MGMSVRVEEEVRGRGASGGGGAGKGGGWGGGMVPNRHIHTQPLPTRPSLTVPTNRHQDYFMRFADPIRGTA